MSSAVHTLTKERKDLIPHVDISGNFPLDESVIAGLQSAD